MGMAISFNKLYKVYCNKVSGSVRVDAGRARAVTVADFYHRGGNGPTTAGGAVLCIFIYI